MINEIREVIPIYIIIMNQDKSLTITTKTNIYRKENMVDKLKFLFPEKYQELELADCTATLKYTDTNNVPHAEILQKDEELYKGKLAYTLPLDSELTEFPGNINLRVTFTKIDMETQTQYVMHTGEVTITVLPLADYYNFVPDKSLEFVDQILGYFQAKIEAVEKIAETYDSEKADNLSYEGDKLQLTANGKPIGDSVTIVSGGGEGPGGDTDDFEVVEF